MAAEDMGGVMEDVTGEVKEDEEKMEDTVLAAEYLPLTEVEDGPFGGKSADDERREEE